MSEMHQTTNIHWGFYGTCARAHSAGEISLTAAVRRWPAASGHLRADSRSDDRPGRSR